jgi:hypothetical protein
MTVRAPQGGRDGTEREDREDEGERSHHVGSLFGEDLGVRSQKCIDIKPRSPIRRKDAVRKRTSGPVLSKVKGGWGSAGTARAIKNFSQCTLTHPFSPVILDQRFTHIPRRQDGEQRPDLVVLEMSQVEQLVE